MDLSHLNPEQRDAVTQIDGPVLVLAGAGTGKTTVIASRIAWMIAQGVAPESILAVTFTNKAAGEMKQRVAALMPQADSEKLLVSTFHSFCCQTLRKHITHFGYTRGFGIADDSDQRDIVRELMKAMAINASDSDLDVNFFRNGISDAKNKGQGPDEVRGLGRASWFPILADVYAGYQSKLRQMNLVDFDDLLWLTVRLWQEVPDIREEYRDRFHYLMVDEFQDTNAIQSQLLNLLVGRRANICVVGDDDQSIYGWRGADISNILDFPLRYPGAKVVKLEQNYRSTNTILSAANAVILGNSDRHEKVLWSERGSGEKLRVFEVPGERDESETVTRLLSHFNFQRAVGYDEMAILFRSNYQSRQYEMALRDKSIPYRIVGAQSFYDRREIKDAMAYLRLVQNPRDDLSLLRIINVPPRSIGARTIDKLLLQRQYSSKPLVDILSDSQFIASVSQGAANAIAQFLAVWKDACRRFAEPGDLGAKARDYLETIGYVDGLGKIYNSQAEAIARWENVREFINSVFDFAERRGPEATLRDFLESHALADGNDRVEDNTSANGGVTMMTVHAAKGLEYRLVMVVGMEQRQFPHERSLADGQTDEERRLFYVAVTRAREFLLFSRVKQRTRFGEKRFMQSSQFLDELPAELVDVNGAELFETPSVEEGQRLIDALKARYALDEPE